MSGLPFFERVLRVTHAHVAHRATPPTRYEPWTNTERETDSYRQFVGYRCVNTETDEVSYCYLVPIFEAATPHLGVYLGPTGDPAHDELIHTIEVWDDA